MKTISVSNFSVLVGFLILAKIVFASEGLITEISKNKDKISRSLIVSSFSELVKALAEIEELNNKGALPDGGIEIVLTEGTYKISETLIFKRTHSGEENRPVIIRSKDDFRAKIIGGIEIKNFKKFSDTSGNERINKAVLDKIYVADLKEYGVSPLPPLELAGFGSQRVRDSDRSYDNYRTFPYPELFFNGTPMILARYPNNGFINVAGVEGEVVSETPHYKVMKNVVLKIQGCSLINWAKEPNILLHGYWHFDWADSYELVESVIPEEGKVKLKDSSSAYGYREGARFYALNLLCELDSPGEWYLDRENSLLYFYPPESIENATIEFSISEKPVFIFDNAKHVYIENIDFSLFAGNILQIFGGKDIKVLGCSFSKSGGYGITIDGGYGHTVQSCDFTYLGKGGVSLRGGDRKILEKSGFIVDNCYFSDLARVDKTYNPAVYAYGVGHTISHNLIRNNPSSAFRVDGNDITIEYNEICNVLKESDDQGALDTWGNPTYRGLVIRHNFWHHIGNWDKEGLKMQGAIRLDDSISGVHIYGNVFYKACAYDGFFGAVQIHGGKDNLIENNIFAECSVGISCTPWAKQYWDDFVKSILDKQEIDMNLYSSRYPEIKELNENINKNIARNNIFWRCKRMLLRAPSVFVNENNLETDDVRLFPKLTEGIFDVNQDLLSSLNINFESIPFEKIGLYIDNYRKTISKELILQLRKE
ncbi:MAG: right-handed parallel beta-helix repeat-containing protein [Candidatus Hydrogenedentes bacterium]|nr:right-handed parallel beta-helix repeat-containing protein [Candidatus Hydrogenedentota bacterium]